MARKKKSPVIPNYPNFPEKLAKSLPTGWWDIAEGMKKEELEKTIVDCEKAISSTENDMSEDTKLLQLKEDKSLLESGYKNVLKTQQAKIKFILYLMNERGYA